ncbi:dihydrolipoyl dehydrogenase [Haloimpatiens massiliensis]|uniref:dihydrolipoyl dehydrogenase n=1 Tax=Haloimpatiens massiliensis TaxID=1658110 RepID=UPI000C8683BF|nr:dihydrolipoyl dehydrogenase [Haloimpatiens massiliensis]
MKIVVIGGGPGGYVAALKAAMKGAEVTVVEKAHVGGTCLNVGCIPTKALIACSEALETIKNADKYGIKIEGEVKPDFDAIVARKRKVTDQLVKGIEFLFNEKGVKLVRGTGKIADKNNVEVEKNDGTKEIIKADKIIIATGSVPVVPPMFPYDGKRVIISDEVLELEKVPKSMIIVGGGPIGCEIGQFYNELGTKVQIVEMVDHLIPFEDEDVAKILQRSFKQSKIKFFVKDGISKVDVKEDKVVATLGSGKELEAEMMLVSVGRRPYTQGLGLEELGVNMERGRIVVNEKMETSVEGIYAIGDTVSTPALAHVASKEGIVAVENALGGDKKMDYRAVPRCVFTSVEVAGVGATEKSLKDQGVEYKVGKFDFRGLGKAQAMGKFQGFVKVITDMNDKILGAAVIGPNATDLLTELTLAVHLGLTAEQVGDAIHPHPTLSEALMEAVHDVNKESVHAV